MTDQTGITGIKEGWLVGFCRGFGESLIRFLSHIGQVLIFAANGVRHIFLPPFYAKLFLRQILEIGYYSLPVIGMTTVFSGMVLALQSSTGFSSQIVERTIPTLVVLAITRELAPVLAGLMVAGRIGAAMAAELGTMRVTEQIDALVTLSTNPWKYLIAPRLLAASLMLPLLVLTGDVLGVFGGWLVATTQLGFNSPAFVLNSWEALQAVGVVSGLVKAGIFGFIIALMGCYHGFHSKGGAQGVGAATTSAVVSASILILVANYFVTLLFFGQ